MNHASRKMIHLHPEMNHLHPEMIHFRGGPHGMRGRASTPNSHALARPSISGQLARSRARTSINLRRAHLARASTPRTCSHARTSMAEREPGGRLIFLLFPTLPAAASVTAVGPQEAARRVTGWPGRGAAAGAHLPPAASEPFPDAPTGTPTGPAQERSLECAHAWLARTPRTPRKPTPPRWVPLRLACSHA